MGHEIQIYIHSIIIKKNWKKTHQKPWPLYLFTPPPIKCFIKCVFFSSFFLSYKVQDQPAKTPNNVVIKWFPANEGKGMIGQIKVRIASLSALPNMTRRERPLSLLPLKHLPPRPSEGTVDPPALFRSLSCSWRFSQAGEGRGWVEGGRGAACTAQEGCWVGTASLNGEDPPTSHTFLNEAFLEARELIPSSWIFNASYLTLVLFFYFRWASFVYRVR